MAPEYWWYTGGRAAMLTNRTGTKREKLSSEITQIIWLIESQEVLMTDE